MSDVAMLVPSFSISLQSPALRPSPHHYSPFQDTSSCFSRSAGRPELSRVYKLPLEERAEPHFKGHRLPQASVLSREIRLTPPPLSPRPTPGIPLFFSRPSPPHTRPFLPSFRPSASGSGDSVSLKEEGAVPHEGREGGGGNQRTLST